jgi:hypothetical protein
MTHLGMFSGRAGSVGIIIAIKAIRHIWSATLTISTGDNTSGGHTIQAVAPNSSALAQYSRMNLLPPESTQIVSGPIISYTHAIQHTLSCSSICRKAIVSIASFPVDLISASSMMGHTCKYQAELYPQLRNSFSS